MDYLYDEVAPGPRRQMDRHLETCPACRDAVDGWQGVRRGLDADGGLLHVPPVRARVGWAGAARWAAAAAAALLTGFGIGRWSGPGQADIDRSVAALRSELQADLAARRRQDLEAVMALTTGSQRELLTGLVRELAATRATDRKEFVQFLTDVEVRRMADLRQLQAGLLSLARETGSGFQQAENRLTELAGLLPVSTPEGSTGEGHPSP